MSSVPLWDIIFVTAQRQAIIEKVFFSFAICAIRLHGRS